VAAVGGSGSSFTFPSVLRIYVDEAGDRGVSPASSLHFVISAVVVQDALDRAARADLATTRLAVGRHSGHVLHYRKLSHSQKLKVAQDVSASSIEMVTSVIVCKRDLIHTGPPGSTAHIAKPDPMYLWALRLLFERISWYARDNGQHEAIVTFAHLRHFKVQALHDYRQALSLSDNEIWWGAFDGHPFRVSDPGTVELLQFADASASALLKAIEPDEFGNTEDRYLRALSSKIYRRPGGVTTSYGLKVFPPVAANLGGPLYWLREI